jgi:agmatinase
MMSPPYQTHNSNFLALRSDPELPFAIVGVPFDQGASHRAGARMAPQHIRQASHMLMDGDHPIWKTHMPDHVCDLGNLTHVSDILKAHEQIAQQAAVLVPQHHVIAMGGDHSVTTPLIQAHAAHHGTLGVLHLDAHCDTWRDHFGEPRGHGTWVRDVVESGWVQADHMVSLGVRSPVCVDAQQYLSDKGGLTLSAQDVAWSSPLLIAQDVHARLQGVPVYLSMDIDVLDPAHAPGTGTPEAAGLSSMWVQSFLRCLFQIEPYLNFVGMDMVEVCPAHDVSEITSLAAATFMWEYASAQIEISHRMSQK